MIHRHYRPLIVCYTRRISGSISNDVRQRDIRALVKTLHTPPVCGGGEEITYCIRVRRTRPGSRPLRRSGTTRERTGLPSNTRTRWQRTVIRAPLSLSATT